MTEATTIHGKHIEISPLGGEAIDHGDADLTIKPVVIDGWHRYSVSVGTGTTRREVILDIKDMLDIAETAVSLINKEIGAHGYKPFGIHQED